MGPVSCNFVLLQHLLAQLPSQWLSKMEIILETRAFCQLGSIASQSRVFTFYFFSKMQPQISTNLRTCPEESKSCLYIDFVNAFDKNICLSYWNNLCLSDSWTQPFVKCTYRTYKMLLKIFPFVLYTSPVSPGFAKQIMHILLILCYNGGLVTWTVVSLTTAKFKSHIFSGDDYPS
jgi:hypothetical protein